MIDKIESFIFNFYKKKFKGIKKNLNLIVQNKIIYAADDMGYLYALDYSKQKLIWAHNYKVPFRSNLKIIDNKVVVSDQNNSILIVDKKW